jgi:peroxiredoxin
MNLAERLTNMEFFDADGEPRRLGAFWEKSPAVLVLVRHFGCLFCREQVSNLNDVKKRMDELGAKLVVLGSGTVQQARWFREDLKLDVAVLSDPKLAAFKTAELRRDWLGVLNLASLSAAFRALKKGFRPGKRMGDAWQNGAVFVFAPKDKVLFSHPSHNAGDHADVKDVLTALENGLGHKA